MADVILVQLLRTYIESLPEGSEGFLGAVRHAGIGREAVAAIESIKKAVSISNEPS